MGAQVPALAQPLASLRPHLEPTVFSGQQAGWDALLKLGNGSPVIRVALVEVLEELD